MGRKIHGRNCPSGKRCYGTKAAAINHAARIVKPDDEYRYMRVYFHAACGWFHLTHQQKRRRR